MFAPFLQLGKLWGGPVPLNFPSLADFEFLQIILERPVMAELHDNVVGLLVVANAVPGDSQ